ncbi:MAG TPA: hypothetical protein VNE40_00295 [Candidatus Dormibacteraeota bacterium]|nr:hypothetical protein [Candidatus Dormibacteraeota bacterium]
MDALQDSLISLIPDGTWLNDPSRMNKAQDKIGQLILAKELGFSIPSTIVSNHWKSIDGFFNEDEYIIKMPKGITYANNRAKVLYTTKLDPAKRKDLSDDNPYPGIFQKFINKQREWRVTVVEDNVFEAAIYTTDEAKDDWRKHQFSDGVRFRRETMPDEHKARCIKFLALLGLRYGTFDFIENDDSEMTFLECNVNGQYRWLEDILDLPISESIADCLMKIARA